MNRAESNDPESLQQPVMTVAQAAVFLGKSTDWVRGRIVRTRLKTLHPYGVAPVLITEASARIVKQQLLSGLPALAARRGDHLRLVIDNTQLQARKLP